MALSTAVGNLLRRTIDVRDEEVAALLWSFAYFFLVLAAYYVIRPIRDQMGVESGATTLPWLFTGTLIGMLLVHPVFTALVGRYPRRVFVPWIYRFFILNLVVFFLLFRAADIVPSVWVGRLFYMWTSVFNLFVVSVFWSFLTDVFRPAQGKRLFGMVAVGGTIGALTGSSITAFFVSFLGPVNLLLVSAVLLEGAGRASKMLERHEKKVYDVAERDREIVSGTLPEVVAPEQRQQEVIGGGLLEGIRHVAKSPYLLGVAGLMVFFTVVSTFLYVHLIAIVETAYEGNPEGSIRLFAVMEMAVQSLTLITQLFLTGRILKWFGIGLSLAFLPLVSLIGFGILGFASVLSVVVAFQVFRRAANFSVQRPAREVLYTVVPRVDKFKSKNFNDTAVYRFGDQVGIWSQSALMTWMGLSLAAIAWVMVPFSAAWLGLALWLGWKYRHYGEDERVQPQPVPTAEAGRA